MMNYSDYRPSDRAELGPFASRDSEVVARRGNTTATRAPIAATRTVSFAGGAGSGLRPGASGLRVATGMPRRHGSTTWASCSAPECRVASWTTGGRRGSGRGGRVPGRAGRRDAHPGHRPPRCPTPGFARGTSPLCPTAGALSVWSRLLRCSTGCGDTARPSRDITARFHGSRPALTPNPFSSLRYRTGDSA
jgi:hypothetical protein